VTEAATSSSALFADEGDQCVRPTDWSRGPWSLDWLHGGPVAALLAHAAEDVALEGDWFTSRLTVELERPVPVDLLRYSAEISRAGRTVSIVDATVANVASGAVLARGRAVRIRRTDVPLPLDDTIRGPLLAVEPAPSQPKDGHEIERHASTPTAFHSAAIEQRFVGDTDRPGPIFDWIRARTPLLPNREMTPLQRVASAVDQASGISAVLPPDTHGFINPDLTIHLFRPPQGEWIGMHSTTLHHTAGTAMTDTVIYDVEGRVGRSNQSLILSER
jgi:hypothetical protein